MEKQISVEEALKAIEPEVDKILIEKGLLKINNDKKEYAFGTVNVMWKIQQQLLKEKFDIDWKTPAEEKPGCFFD